MSFKVELNILKKKNHVILCSLNHSSFTLFENILRSKKKVRKKQKLSLKDHKEIYKQGHKS